MRDRCFCTIVTQSHLAWALALGRSLRQFDPALPFVILISDVEKLDPEATKSLPDIEVLFLKDILHIAPATRIVERYAAQKDTVRWCMKPILMRYLHERYAKVIYGDCDLHFHSDPAWIWQELDEANVLLSPHWRSADPVVDRPNFDLLYVGGLYNAGFIGANRQGAAALDHWAKICLEVCFKDFTKGQCDDQAHLNLLPVYFDRVYPLKHRGCNVANWNMVECERVEAAHGEVLINGVYPIVFIHFTRSMIDGIVSGDDPLLMPHLEILRDRLLEHGSGADIIALSKERLARKAAAAAPPTIPQRIGRAVKKITGGK